MIRVLINLSIELLVVRNIGVLRIGANFVINIKYNVLSKTRVLFVTCLIFVMLATFTASY